MKKLIIAGFAIVSVGSLGLAAYFYFKKKKFLNLQSVRVSEPLEVAEPVSQQVEEQTEEEEPNSIPQLIGGQGKNAAIIEVAKPVSTPIPTAFKDTTAPQPVISQTIPSAKVLTIATIKNTGIVAPSVKPDPIPAKPALKVAKSPVVTVKPKPVAPILKPVFKAAIISKPITRTPARVLKPVQKAAAKRLSGDGWLEAAADDMENRFYGTI